MGLSRYYWGSARSYWGSAPPHRASARRASPLTPRLRSALPLVQHPLTGHQPGEPPHPSILPLFHPSALCRWFSTPSPGISPASLPALETRLRSPYGRLASGSVAPLGSISPSSLPILPLFHPSTIRKGAILLRGNPLQMGARFFTLWVFPRFTMVS